MTKELSLFTGSAVLSPCGRYRYSLTREWREEPTPRMTFIMHNPSTADADYDDPTIRRCIGFATRLGYGSIRVVNLFAFRATDPEELSRLDCGEAVGPENDRYLLEAISCAGQKVAAWGAISTEDAVSRARSVATVCRIGGHQLWCLGKTKHGRPRHPLYLRNDAVLETWEARE